ncbi:hypothetical protein F5Y16DRAFT_311374 [Xylariaceae sp. FL0255]|nr:hypothetical protein F5Y16DRAFT_311374 [Xylariaceae sp. FL0255]
MIYVARPQFYPEHIKVIGSLSESLCGSVMAAPAIGCGEFCFEQLPNTKNHIRLIQIETQLSDHDHDSGEGEKRDEGDVVLEMTTWSIPNALPSDAPPYRAISYIRGDLNQTAWIRINGKKMQVRKNCRDTLL